MASPLPKMNAPALKKNRPSATSVPPLAMGTNHGLLVASSGTNACDDRPRYDGGALIGTIATPAARNNSAISAPVAAVTVNRIVDTIHRRGSDVLVSRASLTAAIAMIAI